MQRWLMLPANQATDAVAAQIRQAASLYHRLVLVVGPAGAGKARALESVRERTGAALANVGLELSRRMLDLTVRQRSLQLRSLLDELVKTAGAASDVVLLDNTELLFDANLQQDPLPLLQSLSRHKTIVAAWTGALEDGKLRYAVPGHPEHRQYPARDLLAVPLQGNDEAP